MIRNKISAGEIVFPEGTEVEAPPRPLAPGQWVVLEGQTGRLIREFGSETERAAWLRRNAMSIDSR
jgi:hypothetical protein